MSFKKVLLAFLVILFPLAIYSADIQMHGDLNNRFALYYNHVDLVSQHQLDKSDVEDWWGEAKYRMWWDMATNDGKVKGVWAVEIGGLEYGTPGNGKSKGGGFSGDGVNIETRWLYTDFKLPWNNNVGVKMGLFGLTLNKYFNNSFLFNIAPRGGLVKSNGVMCINNNLTLGKLC